MEKSNKHIQVISPILPDFQEYVDEIKSIWDAKWLTNSGPKHQQLEKQLKQYMEVENCILYANGHLALETALKGLHLTGEVITTPFTFASTTQAIVNCGLTPVFCDINKDDYCINVDKIEELITEKTSAIIPVHVYGNICDYKKIDAIAKKYNLKVIYDAAHAFGITVDGKSVAALGDLSMFSFHATKVFHTIEGGCLAFKDISLAKDLTALKEFGMYGKEDAELNGINAKMSEFQAAMGICNLRNISAVIECRKNIVMLYRELLKGAEGVILCDEQENVKSNYAYFPIVINREICGVDRDFVCEKLAEEGIFARKYFYPLTSEFSAYKGKFAINITPVAKEVSESILALPLYPELTEYDVKRICKVILKVVQK